VPVGEMSSGGTLLTMVLMLIGAGPGSTGGGIKVTTAFILVLAIISRVRNSEDMNIYERRLDRRFLYKAATSVSIYLLLSLLGSLIVSAQGLGVTETVFETLSAIGTVGLSAGVTAELSAVLRIVIMLLMFVGRVGSLAVATAMMTRRTRAQAAVKYVSERIIVG
jgi:trk system potassium uptake protein TrkH